MKRKCLFCLKEFIPTQYSTRGSVIRYSNAKYCSKNCVWKANYQKHKEYYRVYDKAKNFKWKIERICIVCNKVYLPDTVNQLQCSIRCTRKKWKKAHWRQVLDYDNARARKKARENWVKKNCLFCSKEFLPPIGNKYAIYCSTNCRVKANYRKQIITGQKKTYAQHYRDNNKEKIHKHDEEYKARIRFGATSKTLNKRIVLERDKKTCQLCQKPYQVIHHIRYSGKHEDLVLLCRACHAGLHQRVKNPPYWIGEYHF